MKKIILYFIMLGLSLFCLGYGKKINSYSKTGHEDFKKIIFIQEGKLLVDYTEEEIKESYDKLKRKFLGWQTKEFNNKVHVNYEGVTLFMKSNKTTKKMDFEYIFKETETIQTSVSIKGSVSLKITGTIKKINSTITGTADISGAYENKNVYTTDAKTTINISIHPNTKISMLILGDAYITNGVSRYTILGITTRKGSWERIETDVMYYELREEKV